jgi:hypothetical protein
LCSGRCQCRCDTTRKSAEYWSATYLRNQNFVAGADTHGEALAILVKGTGANGEDLGLVLLLDAALREEDAGGGLGLGLDSLDQDAVQEGSEALDVAEDRLLKQESVYGAS